MKPSGCVFSDQERCLAGPSWHVGRGVLLERSLRLRPGWTRDRGWDNAEGQLGAEERAVEEKAGALGSRDGVQSRRGPDAGTDVSGVDSLVDQSAVAEVRAVGGAVENKDNAGSGSQAPTNTSSEESTEVSGPRVGALRAGPDDASHQVTRKSASVMSDIYFVVLVAGCSAVAVFGVVAAGYCFYKVQKNARAAADVDYPAYGVTGPNKEGASPTADRKLAQSAQMYHFQHQKQQMIAVEKRMTMMPLGGLPPGLFSSSVWLGGVFRNHTNRHTSASDVDTEEEENEEGDYTVYECPGMASGGELEVKNPLFQDDHPIVLATPEDSDKGAEDERKRRSSP
ncbi:uncharacterized protein LOC144140904 isoform X2 [Haemaphysalis longicornis]